MVDQVLVSIAKLQVVEYTKNNEANNIDTSRWIDIFSNAENSNYIQLGLPLSIKVRVQVQC